MGDRCSCFMNKHSPSIHLVTDLTLLKSRLKSMPKAISCGQKCHRALETYTRPVLSMYARLTFAPVNGQKFPLQPTWIRKSNGHQSWPIVTPAAISRSTDTGALVSITKPSANLTRLHKPTIIYTDSKFAPSHSKRLTSAYWLNVWRFARAHKLTFTYQFASIRFRLIL